MDECRSILLHPTKKILCSTSRDGSVRLWNLANDLKPKLTNNLVFHN
jgi:WD40 repeat protein